MFSNAVLLKKVNASIVFKDLENVISFNEVQLSNACSPTLITESGIVNAVKELHLLNAYAPILVTVSGIIIELILLFEKA